MALTNAQLNAHIRDILADELDFVRESDKQVLMFLLRACIRHIRQGGADNIEAGKTVAQFVAQQVLGRALTGGDLHALRRHWTPEADPTAEGLLD